MIIIKRTIFIVVILASLMYGWQTYTDNRSVTAHELRKIHRSYDTAHSTNASSMNAPEIEGGIMNPQAIKNALMPGAQRSGAMVNDQAELEATAAGRLVSHPEQFIRGSENTWKSTGIPVNGPLHVWAPDNPDNKVYRTDLFSGTDMDRSGADGIYADGNLPGIHKGKETIVAGAPYLSLVGRVCSETSCGPEFYIGRDTTICPQRVGSGTLSVRVNHFGRKLVGGFYESLDSSTLKGGYTFKFEQGQALRCDTNAPRAY